MIKFLKGEGTGQTAKDSEGSESEQGVEGEGLCPATEKNLIVVDRNGAFCCILRTVYDLQRPNCDIQRTKNNSRKRPDILYSHSANKVTCIRFLSDLVSDLINSVYLYLASTPTGCSDD